MDFGRHSQRRKSRFDVDVFDTWLACFVVPFFLFMLFVVWPISKGRAADHCSEVLSSSVDAEYVLGFVERSFAVSGKIRYFYAGTEYPLGNGVLKLNRSYTIVVVGDTVVFGEGYVGQFPGTFQATHPKLIRDAGFPELMYQYGGRGGAIFIKSDGEFIISGYHSKASCDFSANLIARLLLEAEPTLRLRSTPHRLSEFLSLDEEKPSL